MNRCIYSRGSSGGSYCTIQSTCGMSRPRAATSVQSKMPDFAWQNEKNVHVRFCCFCLPYMKKKAVLLYVTKFLIKTKIKMKTSNC